MTEHLQPERASLLGLVAALALYDAIVALAPAVAPALKLKWPNDLLLDGAKLAGILIEAETGADAPGVSRMAIGIGCNCTSTPDGLAYSTASLAGEGITAMQLFHELSQSWAIWLTRWREPGGFAIVRDRWLDHATGLGAPIIVRLPAKELSGTFEDLDRQGRLILKDQTGARTVIGYGEVFFGTPTKAEQ